MTPITYQAPSDAVFVLGMVAQWLVCKPVGIPAGVAGTRVREIVDLRNATQR